MAIKNSFVDAKAGGQSRSALEAGHGAMKNNRKLSIMLTVLDFAKLSRFRNVQNRNAKRMHYSEVTK